MKPLSHVRLFATPWTVAYQAPLSIGFSRQQYWSGLPFPSPADLPNPGIKPGLQHCRQTLYRLSHQESTGKEGKGTRNKWNNDKIPVEYIIGTCLFHVHCPLKSRRERAIHSKWKHFVKKRDGQNLKPFYNLLFGIYWLRSYLVALW